MEEQFLSALPSLANSCNELIEKGTAIHSEGQKHPLSSTFCHLRTALFSKFNQLVMAFTLVNVKSRTFDKASGIVFFVHIGIDRVHDL